MVFNVQPLCTSIHRQSVSESCSIFLLEPHWAPFSEIRFALKRYSRFGSMTVCPPLHLLFVIPADGPRRAVGDMRRDGLNRNGRHSNRPRDVLVPLSQKDRLHKASRF